MKNKRIACLILTSIAAGLLAGPSNAGECCLVNEHNSFTPATAEAGDRFGSSLSVSGVTLVVGAPATDVAVPPPGDPLVNAGVAYIYTLEDDAWEQVQEAIKPSTGHATLDDFGRSVGISGTAIIVGASLNDDAASNAGSAYIFDLVSGEWQQQAQLNASDAAASDNFGFAVAISGDVAVVGAPNDGHSSFGEAGSAYVFRKVSGTWTQEAKLIAASPGPADDLNFGRAVAIDGNTIVVGEPGSFTSSRFRIYVYSTQTQSWSQQATFAPSASEDYSVGWSVAIQGDVAVVGAPGGDRVYIYYRSGSSWSNDPDVLDYCDAGGSDDRFGESVAISGNYIVVGAPDNDNDGLSSGSAYAYELIDEEWTEVAKMYPCEGASAGDKFGAAVTTSGGVAISGAPFFNEGGAGDQGRTFNYAGAAPCRCIADLDDDTEVDGIDLALLLGEWGACPCGGADLDGNGVVNGIDLAMLLGGWGRCPGDESCPGGESFSSSGGSGTAEDEVAALLGFSSAQAFYAWIRTASEDDIQAAGIILQEFLSE